MTLSLILILLIPILCARAGSADGKVRFIDLAHPSFRCLHTLDLAAHLRREESKQWAADAHKRAAAERGAAAVVISGGAHSHHSQQPHAGLRCVVKMRGNHSHPKIKTIFIFAHFSAWTPNFFARVEYLRRFLGCL